VAAIAVLEGITVAPLTTLHLDGSGSTASVGMIRDYQWLVREQPPGSTSQLVVDPGGATASFFIDLAGSYTFELTVVDDGDRVSCFPATAVVEVVPIMDIHVQLVWNTPNDPVQDHGIGAGSDMDVHLVHPLATGRDIDGDGAPDGWFDATYDCFSSNLNPDWGPPGGDGDPYLDIDDTDGWGPENISVIAPEAGTTYRAGVHYYHDHGFGVSQPFVRVFIGGVLAFEATGSFMNRDDFWPVATIEWPSGQVLPITDASGNMVVVPGATATPP